MTKKAGDDLERLVVTGYETVLGREPHAEELSATVEFLKLRKIPTPKPSKLTRASFPTDFAQTLFGLNEFIPQVEDERFETIHRFALNRRSMLSRCGMGLALGLAGLLHDEGLLGETP